MAKNLVKKSQSNYNEVSKSSISGGLGLKNWK